MNTPTNSAKSVAMAGLGLAFLAGVACSSSSDETLGEESIPGSAAHWIVPSENLADWVAFSDQISIVTILRIEQLPLDAQAKENNEGYVGAMMTARLDETLWVMPGVEATTGTIHFQSSGWALHEGLLTSFNPDAEVGARYLVALGRFESGLSPIRPPTIRVVEGRLVMGSAARNFSLGWMEDHAGKTVDEMRAVLDATPVDEVALQFADLEMVARVAAVQAARRPTETVAAQD